MDDKGRGNSVKRIKGEEVECKMKFSVYQVKIDKNADKIEIKLDDDLVKYEWCDLSKLNQYKLTPPSIELFEKLGYI